MKRNLKVFCASVLAGLSMLPFAACGDMSGEKDKQENFEIRLSESMLEMSVGESHELKVTVSPSDPMEKTVEWKTSDDGVASVEKGKVTAKAEGETTITATSNGKSDTCKVTVKPSAGEDSNLPDTQEPENNGSTDKNDGDMPIGENKPEGGDSQEKQEMPDGETPENGPEE